MIKRRWHIAGSVLVLGFQLAGCGLTNDVPKPATSKPVVAKPAEDPAKSQRHPPMAVTKPAKPASPDELIGLDESGVRKVLGSPAETRNDNAARILSYRHSAGCALDVIFFMDLKAGDLRVLSYQWNSDGARSRDAASCYAELRVTS